VQFSRVVTVVLVAVAGLIGVPSARADYFTNLPGSNNGNFVNIGAGLSYAVGFMNSSTVDLKDAELILTTQAPAADADVLSLYSDVAGKPGVDLATFTTPSFSVGTAKDTFDITYTLQANTSYFLVLTGGADFSQWSSIFTANNLDGVTPTGTGATYLTQLAGSGPVGGAPTSYTPSSVIPNFQLDVAPATLTTTPEPSSVGLFGLIVALVLCILRARKHRAA
jgi:hypothetical protein